MIFLNIITNVLPEVLIQNFQDNSKSIIRLKNLFTININEKAAREIRIPNKKESNC